LQHLDAATVAPSAGRRASTRIPNEMYKVLSDVFAQAFTDLINETQRTGRLPQSFLEGDISMLYKKGDRADPRNYRPITLLNTDDKIFTRVLSKRTIKVIHEIVSETQKGFVPDVLIADASMSLRLIEAYVNDEQRIDKESFSSWT
jgi:hypothetical protein